MFNSVLVSFPNTTVAPLYVYSLSFYQNKYEHEIASITFRDWNVQYDVVEAGSPITFTITNDGKSRVFYGYVHSIVVDRTPGSFLTEVIAVSASMVMKNESQTVYTGLSADAVIQKIAKKHNFVAFTVPHPRIYPQIAQAGHTDWELCVRLAKQSGYSLRTENTEIYFQPMLYEYETKRAEASRFIMREPNDPSGSTIYSFNPAISEGFSYDGDMKAAVAISGLDSSSVSPISLTKQIRAPKTKHKSSNEFFDKFHTHVVATDPTVAAYEAEAADNRNVFPYRASAEVKGDPTLRPDLPVYLDGLGAYYTGYWIVLGVEHRIVEQERNSHVYTSILYLGTDSLGVANRWTDGKSVVAPDARPTRVVIPGVRQTNVVPKTTIKRVAPQISPSNKGAFGLTSNRSTTQLSSPLWKTGTATLNPITQPVTSQQPSIKRLLTKVPKL
jgi:Phage tail baseplate hub (GPD)